MTVVTVAARVRLPGFHYWPDAGGRRAYLADRHRHLFGVTAEVRVGHDDRDVEFHDLSDVIRCWWRRHSDDDAGAVEWGASSCEAIASQLAAHLAMLGLSVERVAVDEDGEHTATVYPARTTS